MIRRYLFPIFRSIYLSLVLLTIVLSVCIWFFAPYIGGETWRPFDSITSRIVTISILWGVMLAIMLTIFLLRRRRDRKMSEDIADAVDQDPGDEIVQTELGDLRAKLKTAMVLLRKSKNGRKHLNELPWYVLIGPPGAGKTTAIVNSGLQFPLADEMGKTAIGGVGGTRNCDWWFTNNAVLIDTAGRYTTQESDADADNAAWIGFLGLLKKYRKRQPINGALIAISLSDLSLQDETTQMGHAKAVRRRLHELREKLGVRFPVYVLFTKADLIAGFSEFHERLGKEDREQVWGFTLPMDRKKAEHSPISGFDSEFAQLLGRLNAQSLELMQGETDHQRRSLIAGFPSQVASVRRVARDFLNEVFQDNRYERRHMLRGVYFTSGTQEGTPIDRLMMGMAKTFGIGRQAIGSGHGSGRSFFLTRLFEDVVFREAGLVSADDKVERRYRWTKRAAITATILLALGTGALWTRSYLGNQKLIGDAERGVTLFQAAAATIPGSPIGDTDLPEISNALNILRDLPGNPVLSDPEPAGSLKYGLYQGDVIGTQVAQTYRAALNEHLLPRLLLRLEEQMQANLNTPEVLYEALKVYLMLGLQGPMNKGMVTDWMQADWTLAYPGIARQQLRDDLMDHLTAMLSQPMQEIALNGPLIEQAQSILSEMSLAQRVYNGIINSPKAKALPKWRITEAGGPAVKRVLVRSSGKPLSDGIEGVFTFVGFNQFFLGEALSVTTRIQRESWVLGPRGEAEQTDAALLKMSRDVLNLYYTDYISRYDNILGDIEIVPLESPSHAAEVVNVLSGPTSPIANILTEIDKETRLTASSSLLDSTGVGKGLKQVGALELRSNISLQGQIFLEALSSSPLTGSNEPPKPPGAYVEDRFAWLHDLVVRPDGQPSQLDELMGVLTDVTKELRKQAFSGVTNSDDQSAALLQFQEMAAGYPGPLQRWAAQIAQGAAGITSGGTRASINARWQADILPFCEQALKNRYPFTRRAKADVALQDFQKLFAPNGLIDGFFNQNLAKFVDMRTRPWSWKVVNNTDLGISPTVLKQMQFAAEIRDAFFAGSPTPAVSFQISPEALDPKARSVLLEVDGQQVGFKHRGGQLTPVAMTWPGSVGMARVTFEPKKRNTENSFAKDGPWAWFRLLDAAEVRATNVSDRQRLIFNIGGRIAIFQIQSGSVLNPFALPALSKFSCPKSF